VGGTKGSTPTPTSGTSAGDISDADSSFPMASTFPRVILGLGSGPTLFRATAGHEWDVSSECDQRLHTALGGRAEDGEIWG
jgi:hypothetical protein